MTPNDLEPLSPELQALLAAERPLTSAPAAAKSRLLAKLSTELFEVPGGDGGGSEGGSSSSGPSSGPGPSGAPPTGAGVSGAGVSAAGSGLVAKAVVAKLVVGASVASMAVGGAIGAGVHSAVVEERERQHRLAAPERPATERPPEPPPPPVVTAEPPPSPSTPVVIPPTVTAPAKPQLSADEQLALEKSYVEQARVAMARQDPNGALEALAHHQRRFPNGQLTEERMALEVMALSSAGRSIEARNAANAFRKRFPAGLLRSAVDATAPEE